MTRIDPFAPGDDPRHPSNFAVVTQVRQPESQDWDVFLLLDPETDADGVGREEALSRQPEYDALLLEFGTQEEQLSALLDTAQERAAAGVPALGALRKRERQAAAELDAKADAERTELADADAELAETPQDGEQQTATEGPQLSEEDELAAALAALDDK